MFGIGDFFKRVQGTFGKEIFARTIAQQSIRKHANIEVRIEDLSFSNKDLVVKGISQTAASILYIKKQAIIREINSLQSSYIVSNLRF